MKLTFLDGWPSTIEQRFSEQKAILFGTYNIFKIIQIACSVKFIDNTIANQKR